MFIKTEHITKGNLQLIRSMGRGYSNFSSSKIRDTNHSIKESLKLTRSMGKVITSMRTEITTMDNLETG